MTKHRTITGFVALALLTGAATAATLRPLPSRHHPNASAGIMSFSELKVDVNKLATDNYDDQSFVYSAKRHWPHAPQPAWRGIVEIGPT